MKKLIYTFFFSCSLFSCKSQSSSDLPFANITHNEIEFLQDTTAFKNHIRQSMNFKAEVNFDKIEILKQFTIGIGNSTSSEFYYVLISDTKHNYKVARWLNRIDDRFYINNKSHIGDQFEQTFLICVGVDNCYPEVFDIDGKKSWGCNKDPKCLLQEPDPETIKCRSYKTLLVDDLKE